VVLSLLLLASRALRRPTKVMPKAFRAAFWRNAIDGPIASRAELQDRVMPRVGTVPEPPAQTYDRTVRAAICRLPPGAEVIRQEQRSREVADFVIRYRGNELLLAET
jgi:hypothetical protein